MLFRIKIVLEGTKLNFSVKTIIYKNNEHSRSIHWVSNIYTFHWDEFQSTASRSTYEKDEDW